MEYRNCAPTYLHPSPFKIYLLSPTTSLYMCAQLDRFITIVLLICILNHIGRKRSIANQNTNMLSYIYLSSYLYHCFLALHMTLTYCLHLFISARTILFSISHRAMNSLSFHLFRNVLIFLSILKNVFLDKKFLVDSFYFLSTL